MPSKWFSKEHHFLDKSDRLCKVLVLCLDTSSIDLKESGRVLQYGMQAYYLKKQEAEALLHQFEKEQPLQLEWLENQLQSARDKEIDYIVVCGHYQVYSVGARDTSKVMLDVLTPLLEKHGVDFYINGHEHTIQATKQNGVVYSVAGSATNIIYRSEKPKPEFFISRGPGFVRLDFSKEQASLSLVDFENNILHEETVSNRHLSE